MQADGHDGTGTGTWACDVGPPQQGCSPLAHWLQRSDTESAKGTTTVAPPPRLSCDSTISGATHILRILEQKGLLMRVERLGRRCWPCRPKQAFLDEPDVTLTAPQREALEHIPKALTYRRVASVLLHGVTGSGKTEVYMRAMAAALSQGNRLIYLVPEIA